MKTKMILPCLRGVLGEWVYYSSVMNAQQVNDWILPAKEIREAKSLDEILQRDLKERKKQIANYLLNDGRRFFNSIIVGVFSGVPDWIEFDLTKTQVLVGSSDEFATLKDSIGLLIFNGDEEMFAIDGQHRVAGIQIAFQQDEKHVIEKRILKDDQFPILFIAHIDDEMGRKRTRKLFSDINKNAKGVSQGDQIKIDEENLNAIVTRRLYANYEYFKKGKLISLTEQERLEKNDTTHFTNLLGINNTNKVLRKLFKKIPKTKEWDEENVKIFYSIAKDFFDFAIKNIKDYDSFFIKKKLTIARARKNNSYLLFRPVGLKLLGRLYAHYSAQEKGLEDLKNNINKINFVFPESPFNNLLWIDGKMKAREKNQKLAFEIALYLFGDLSKEREKSLLERYREIVGNPALKLPDKV